MSGGGGGEGDSGGGGKGVENGDGSAPGHYGEGAGGGGGFGGDPAALPAMSSPGGGSSFDNLPNIGGVDVGQFTGGGAAPGGAGDYTAPTGGFTSTPGFSFDSLNPGGWDATGAGGQGIAPDNLNLGGVYNSTPAGIVNSGDALPGNSSPAIGTLPELGATTAPAAGLGASSISGLPGVGDDIGANRNIARGGGSPGAGSPGAGSGGGDQAGGVLSSLGIKNPIGTALAAGGLAYNAIQGSQPRPSTDTIQQQAAMLNDNGKQLMSYLQNGNLPPGLKTSLDQATAGAKAKVIQNFASQGMSTDPSKNSALAQQLAQIDQQAVISTAQIGQQLMQTGVQSSGMASDLYKTLSQIDATQTDRIGKSIAAMAAALNGGGSGLTLKVA